MESHTPEPPADRLEVRYSLTEADAAAGYWQGMAGHPEVRRKLIPLMTLILLGGSVMSWATGGWPLVLVTLGAIVFLFWKMVPWMVRLQARGNPAFRGPHTLWIAADGVGGRTDGVGDTRLFWPRLVQIRTTRSHVLLHWQGGCTTLIPITAFESTEAADEFVERARAWQATAAGPA